MSGPQLTPERWRTIEEIFLAASDAPPTRRDALLQERCGGDAALLADVRELIAAQIAADNWVVPDPAGSFEDRRRVGPFELERLIGRGGMGVVYLAHRADGQFEQKVAIKLIGIPFEIESFRERFRRERQILANLDHPNITRLLDGGLTSDGELYIALEYVNGEPLTRYCEDRSLTTPQRLRLFRDICSAVQYAHQHLVIHRDLKPGNILVTPDGTPKLLDFGTAKLLDAGQLESVTGMSLITPAYASPEQLMGQPVSTLADVYALGVILFELLGGRRPLQSEGGPLSELERVFTDHDVPRVSEIAASANLRNELRGDLDNIVAKALEKDPARRYCSVEQFSDDILRHLECMPITASQGKWFYRTGKLVRRHVWPLALAGVTAVSLLAATIYSAQQARRAGVQTQKAIQINRLMREMLTPSQPRTGGKGIDVRLADVLDAAVSSLDKKSVPEREVEAEVRRYVGNAYMNLGQFDKGLTQFKRDLTLQLQIHPHDHPQTAIAYTRLAQIQTQHTIESIRRQGYRDARSAVAMWRRLGKQALPINYNEALYQLCIALEAEKDVSPAAEAEFREAVMISSRVEGPQSTPTFAILNLFANWYVMRGQLAQGEATYLRAREIGRVLARSNPSLVDDNCRAEVAFQRNRFRAGQPAEAEKELRALIESVRNEPAAQWSLGYVQMMLGETLLWHKEPVRAEPVLRDAATVFRKLYKGDNGWKAASLRFVGICDLELGKTREAVPALQEAYQIDLRVNGPKSPYTMLSKARLDEALGSR